VDGEGRLTVGIWPQHKHALKFNLIFSVAMKRGHWENAVSEILNDHGIPFHTYSRKNQFSIAVTGNRAVKMLIEVLLPYLVVKKALAEKLLLFPKAPKRNRFSQIDSSYLDGVCEITDFVRAFNKSKNRKHKWNGTTIKKFYEEVARGRFPEPRV
jgi:hypothetical protein